MGWGVINAIGAVFEAARQPFINAGKAIFGEKYGGLIGGGLFEILMFVVPGDEFVRGAVYTDDVARFAKSASYTDDAARILKRVSGSGLADDAVDAASWLARHEEGISTVGRAGHTIARHVGKSYKYLRGRNIKNATSFFNSADAERLIIKGLRESKNISKYRKFLDGATDFVDLRVELDEITGYGIYDRKDAYLYRGIRILLKRRNGKVFIETAHPLERIINRRW